MIAIMSTTDLDELVRFAANLTEPALHELSAGYADLVNRFASNDALRKLVEQRGLDVLISGDDPVITDLQKGNREFATTAEERAEKAMRDRVLAAYPTHSIVGEELGATSGDEWLWVFDPVDGTSAMIRTAIAHAYGVQLPEPVPVFGVTIAVVNRDEAVIGVVGELRPEGDGLAMPNIWIGANGRPTTCNGTPVSAPRTPALQDAVLTCTVPEVMFATHEKWSGFQALRDATSKLVVDQNCIGFVKVLSDDEISIATERDLTLPDAAALIPVLVNAGAVVTTVDGSPCRFDEAARSREYTILTAPPGLHEQALACMGAGVPDSDNEFKPLTGPINGYPKKFAQ